MVRREVLAQPQKVWMGNFVIALIFIALTVLASKTGWNK